MKGVVWSIKDIANVIIKRRANEFDSNIAAIGNRGDGKSTLLNKTYYRLPRFNPWKHQEYGRENIIKLLKTENKGICWDDEAINTGYKRDFQSRGQQELIKILTMYRDNYNTFGSAIPTFFSLDKDLRDLYFIVFHIIQRGIAVVHMPLQGRMYSQDRWDAKNNARIEESWTKKSKTNPSFKPQYHKLSTFRGYLYFNDVTERQKALYKEIKKVKRDRETQNLLGIQKVTEKPFISKVYDILLSKKLTKEGLLQMCLVEGRKYSVITTTLNRMLTDNGEEGTLSEYLQQHDKEPLHSKTKTEIESIVPNF